MRLLFSLVLLVSCLQSYAQYDYSQYTKSDKFTYGMNLRGKAFAFPGWEDRFYYTYTIGTELRFLRRHSLGIDYVFFGINRQWDDIDSNGMDLSTGPTEQEKRKYLHLDYRFYFALRNKESVMTPYFNVFTKQGVRTFIGEDNDPEKLLYKSREPFRQYGGGFGMLIDFGEGRCGLDICAGVASYSGEETVFHPGENGSPDEYTINQINRNAPYARVLFFFYLFRF